MNKINNINNILESLVSINEDMKSISHKNGKIPYKISNSTFNLAKRGAGN